MINEDGVSKIVVDSAIEVHKTLGGPGLLESVYEEALVWELNKRGLKTKRQILLPVSYKGRSLDSTLRIDLMVSDLVLVECKATTREDDIFKSQLLTYLRLTRLKLGLLINFGKPMVKNGIHRIVNRL